MTAIWNHDRQHDRHIITSGGNVTVIGPGAMIEVEGNLAKEILDEAKRTGIPFSTEPSGGVVVGGQVFTKPTNTLMVPARIFDEKNLTKLDLFTLSQFAESIGASAGGEFSRAELVSRILELTKPTVPPTATGETNTGEVTQE